jgi:hypothetical protein
MSASEHIGPPLFEFLNGVAARKFWDPGSDKSRQHAGFHDRVDSASFALADSIKGRQFRIQNGGAAQ